VDEKTSVKAAAVDNDVRNPVFLPVIFLILIRRNPHSILKIWSLHNLLT
nr:hypothetical protein [Tanacetum cinerariifolium]